MALLRWIPGFLLAVLAVLFAIANRQLVTVHWNPFNESPAIPLYLIVLGLTAFGFITGGLVVWLNTLPLRFNNRAQKKRIRELEREIEKLSVMPLQQDNNPQTRQPRQPLAALNFFKG